MMTKKILPIVFFILMTLAAVFCVAVTLKNNKSAVFQFKELIAPSKYSKGQMQNLKEDLSTAMTRHEHEVLGREYAAVGNYEKAVEEYWHSIKLAQQEKTEWDQIFAQRFPRYQLFKVYEALGSYKEALGQIDWLIANKPDSAKNDPSDFYRLTLPAKKTELIAKLKEKQTTGPGAV